MRVARIVEFVIEALTAGDPVVVTLTPDHWRSAVARITASGIAPRALAGVRFVDATDLLDRVTVAGSVRLERIQEYMRPVLEGLDPVRFCGERSSLIGGRSTVEAALARELEGREMRRGRPIDVDMSSLPSTADDREDPAPLVLLADDYEDAREMYGQYLEFAGFRVILACDGDEAVNLARQHRPDLILMDIRMPVLTGTAAMRQLREDKGFAGVPIIALTAHALDSERAAILADGFDGVISKPCLPDQLAQAVRMTLDGRAAADDPDQK
jgi:CheY-like chemotaxis protein